MNRALLSLIGGLALAFTSFAHLPDHPNEGLRLTRDNPLLPDDYTLSWWVQPGRAYFLQYSVDLITWVYFPQQPVWTDAPIEEFYEQVLSLSGFDQFYLRLIYPDPDIPSNFPPGADYDGDKVLTVWEIEGLTDPLGGFTDTDGDGMSDDWELRFGLNPGNSNDATLNPDEDAYTNLQEYQNGTEGTDPNNYYNVVNPSIQAVSGNRQISAPGTFSPEPLVIELKIGANPVVNGPVRLRTDGASSGQISLTNDGTGLATTLYLTTDSIGRVSVYFKRPAASPPGGDAEWLIRAAVGSTGPNGVFSEPYYQAVTQIDYTYLPGTLGHHVAEAIDTRLAASVAAQVNTFTAKLVFSTQHHGTPLNPTPVYIRNTSSWCYDLRQPMTCISPFNSSLGTAQAGTAITAQHIVTAKHFRLKNNDTVRFITANAGPNNPEVVETRMIVGSYNHPSGDVTIHTLDSPLPATITPCRVLPANYATYLSYLGGGRPPVLYLDKEEKALVKELRAVDASAIYAQPFFHADRLPYYEDLIDDDSGNPTFLIINNSLVLLSVASWGGPSLGTFLTTLSNPTLNEMIVAADADATVYTMTTVNTGLQVQTVNLGGFNEFTPP